MVRYLVAALIFVAAALSWLWLVSALGIWWTLRHLPAPDPSTDTYFIAGSWIWRLAVILPLVFFSAWYWRRVSHAA
jgi:ABC-type uncharacterized transport system permease subunit